LPRTCDTALAASFTDHGVSAAIAFIDGEKLREAAEGALAQAKRGEIDAIVVGGGDGSVRTVAGVLADTGVPLGVLPLRHAQSFRQGSRIPLKVEQAAAAIAAGHTRKVDIAEVNGKTFINNSSIGIYPYMVIDRERRRATHKLAKWMAMIPGLLPHASPFSPPALAHLGKRLRPALPHAMRVRRQQRIRHGALYLRPPPPARLG
jgi:diacylglycerol kinase family enzyme